MVLSDRIYQQHSATSYLISFRNFDAAIVQQRERTLRLHLDGLHSILVACHGLGKEMGALDAEGVAPPQGEIAIHAAELAKSVRIWTELVLQLDICNLFLSANFGII